MTHQLPTYNVIIPTYNRAALTVRAIESALACSFAGNVEAIVIDDASTDATMETLRERYSHNPYVRLLHLGSNQGPSGARNHGLAAARGGFIVFLDSDDTLMKDALAFAQEAFRQFPEVQFLTLEGEATSIDNQTFVTHIVRGQTSGWTSEGFDAERIHRHTIYPPSGIISPPCTLEFGNLFPAILFGELFWLSGLVIRRSAALAAGPFNTCYRNLEDWDFTARLCLSGVGGYLDHVGFHRETGRADQLSNAGSTMLRAMMHQNILANVRNTGWVEDSASRRLMHRAQAEADYWLGCCLLEHDQPGQARAYLMRAVLEGYKPLKALALLAGGKAVTSAFRSLSSHQLLH